MLLLALQDTRLRFQSQYMVRALILPKEKWVLEEKSVDTVSCNLPLKVVERCQVLGYETETNGYVCKLTCSAPILMLTAVNLAGRQSVCMQMCETNAQKLFIL